MSSARRLMAALVIVGSIAGPASAAAGVPGESPDRLLASAKKAYGRKDYKASQRLARRIISDHSESDAVVDARLVLIDALFVTSRLQACCRECEKLLAAHPHTRRRTAVLHRMYQVGKALTQATGTVLIFNYRRTAEGIAVLERVVELSPHGPFADDAVFAIAEALRVKGDCAEARDQYSRLIREYHGDERLLERAIVGRAVCNARLVGGAPYDSKPAEDAERDFDLLARASGGDKTIVERRDRLRETLAGADYRTGIFYLRRNKLEAGLRYMKAVVEKYPESSYAGRARRILEKVESLRAAQSKETP